MVSAVFAGVVGYLGLRTWKTQLAGKTEYEAGRRLLEALYKVRDAIRVARSPIGGSSSQEEVLEQAGLQASDLHRPEAQEAMAEAEYQVKLNALWDAWLSLQASAYQAEAIWGREIRERLDRLRRLVVQLPPQAALYFGLRQRVLIQLSPEHLATERDVRLQALKVLYAVGEDDVFGGQVKDAVGFVEDYVRQRLKL